MSKDDTWESWCYEILGRIQPENPREFQPMSSELSNGEKPSKGRSGNYLLWTAKMLSATLIWTVSVN